MGEDVFHFKGFSVSHCRSSMKVGVDAVLLGAWIRRPGTRILEVGTGCGVIALILAQKLPDVEIDAIDIDIDSIKEAKENFKRSQWNSRLHAELISWEDKIEEIKVKIQKEGDRAKYDLILSNPPYFDSGVHNPTTSREKARHQSSLSVFTLIKDSGNILKENGVLGMIFPMEYRNKAVELAKKEGLEVKRECRIRNNSSRPYKRVMIELKRTNDPISQTEVELLTLFATGEPTMEYRHLCRDLYLKF